MTLIDITEADLDRPLYRIYPLWFFESALRVNGGNLALIPPASWDDPQEDPCSLIQMAHGTTQKPLSGYLLPAYAQCWSLEGDSDALLRAYSRVSIDPILGRNTEPRFEGVQVRTTPRSLSNALQQYVTKRGDGFLDFYLAKVTYIENPSQVVVDRLAEVGPSRLGRGWDRAKALTYKRPAFQHEQEVRIIALTPPGTNAPWIAADIDPTEVFHEISFDSRLRPFEQMERTAHIRALGYKGPVTTNANYATLLTLAQLPKHWDELDANQDSEGEDLQ